jgi:glycosyltransferase involved in cell wall biosynthesis
LIRAFDAHDIEVLLATMGRPMSREQRESAADLSNLEVAESAWKLEWMDDPWRDVEAAGEWLLGLEENFAPEIVHLNGCAHGALPWRAPKIVVGHSCVLSWWKAVKGEAAPREWSRYHKAVQRGFHAADLVLAPSGAMLNSILEHYGLLPETRVIANGRALAKFQPGKKEDFILSAGRLWDEAKNVRAVCACSSELQWPVCVAGETQHPSHSGSSDNSDRPNEAVGFKGVRCLGRLSEKEMADWLGRASIYALPARYEPFGLSILEAALSGCALVLGDIPSLRENWTGAALFVNPSDQSGIVEALKGLVSHPARRGALAELARERAHDFDIDVIALRYLEAYASVMERNTEEICAA